MRPMEAPIAAGRPKPMVPRPPDVMKERGRFDRVMLGDKHLVLADISDDDRILALQGFSDLMDRHIAAAAAIPAWYMSFFSSL